MGEYFPDLSARNASQMGNVDQNPVQLVAEEVAHLWDIAFLWGRSNGTSGEHPKGLALDFSVLDYGGGVSNPGPANMREGDEIAAYLWKHRARLGVWYIIWNRRIISTNTGSYAFGKWTPYNGSSPHTDHVHGSFYAANVYQPPSEPLPIPEDEMPSIDDFLQHQVELTDGERQRYGYGESISVRSLLVHGGGGARQLTREHDELLANVQQQETAIHQLAQQVAELLAKLEPKEPDEPQGEQSYTVAKGDTLDAIAARFGVTTQAITERNSVSDPNKIFIGQVLIIPAQEGAQS